MSDIRAMVERVRAGTALPSPRESGAAQLLMLAEVCDRLDAILAHLNGQHVSTSRGVAAVEVAPAVEPEPVEAPATDIDPTPLLVGKVAELKRVIASCDDVALLDAAITTEQAAPKPRSRLLRYLTEAREAA